MFKSFTLNKYNSLQIFQFLRFGAFFLISILLAKITYYQYSGGYGTLIISRYEMLLLLSGSLTWFWVSSITNTLIPFYSSSSEEKQKRILFNAFVLLTFFSLLAGIAAFVTGYFNPEDKDLYQMFAIVIFLNTPSYLADYIFYLKEKYRSLIIWGSLTFLAQILLLCWPIFNRQTLNLAINLWLILSLVKFNYTIILLMKYSTITIHTRLIMDFMKKVTPFMFSILLAGSMDYINSYIVSYYFSKVDFAIFRYASKELPIFLILANSLSNIYSGEIANLNKEGQLEEGLKRLKQSSRRLMRWLFPATILLIFTSKYLFQLAYNKDLVEGYQVFNIYLLLIISRMIFPQTVIMGLMKNRVFYLISTNYLIINLILSFWFVQLELGLRGIAYATVISYIIEKIMLVIYCKTQGVDVKKYTPIGELILYSIITIVAYILSLNFSLPDLASF
ncbi:MAG: lipopolysaccharide biosynthesis protein [Bacteroidia bacterium]